MKITRHIIVFAICLLADSAGAAGVPSSRPAAITMKELDARPAAAVEVVEVSDYAFGNYVGPLPSPPNADGNPKRAFVIRWKDKPYRFVFSHEGSYCPWFEFPASGAGVCWQFWEGNDGWAELFNEHGRKERNSFVDVIENAADRVWIRWNYLGVNVDTGAAAYRAVEDFYAYPNGLVVRRQTFESLMPADPHGYTREPIEMIGMCPVGKMWKDVLRSVDQGPQQHALSVLDAFSSARCDTYWTADPASFIASTQVRSGDWKTIDDAKGVAMVLPLKDGLPFCILGDASGYAHETNRLKDHSFKDTGGVGWGSTSWDHWPIGWLNSQGHEVDVESLKKYPNHFSPMGLDLFALPNEHVEKRDFWSLYGVASDFEPIRGLAKGWLESKSLVDASRLDVRGAMKQSTTPTSEH